MTVVLGFLQICAGVVLLQLSKSAKDVPDAAVFKGDLDQVRTVAEQEEPESEPKADAIRGTAAIIRRLSNARQKNEAAEAKRVHEDKMKDQMEPIGEDEQVEWDGLRRRKTVLVGPQTSLRRHKTLHPPLGMARFPDEEETHEPRPPTTDVIGSGGGVSNGRFMNSFRRGSSSRFKARKGKALSTGTPGLTELPMPQNGSTEPATAQVLGAMEMNHVYGLPPNLRNADGTGDVDTEYHSKNDKHILVAEEIKPPTPPPHAKRQFSFTNVFNRHKHDPPDSSDIAHEHRRPLSRLGIGSRQSSKEHSIPGLKTATEEERLGLVRGDSTNMVTLPDYVETSDEDDWQLEDKPRSSQIHGHVPLIREEKESDEGDGEGEAPVVPKKDTPRLGQSEDAR